MDLTITPTKLHGAVTPPPSKSQAHRLLIAAALLAVIPLALLRDTDFAGADGAAEEIVQELDPDYEPIAQPILEPPGGETESLLFCLQAALGAGVLGFGFGWLAARKKYQGGASAESPSKETP